MIAGIAHNTHIIRYKKKDNSPQLVERKPPAKVIDYQFQIIAESLLNGESPAEEHSPREPL